MPVWLLAPLKKLGQWLLGNLISKASEYISLKVKEYIEKQKEKKKIREALELYEKQKQEAKTREESRKADEKFLNS